MIKQWIVAVVAAVVLLSPVAALAHEGHPHRFMGTVSVVQDAQIEVTLTDGKVVTFALDAKTIYRQGKTKVIGRLPKDGERVVVFFGSCGGQSRHLAPCSNGAHVNPRHLF